MNQIVSSEDLMWLLHAVIGITAGKRSRGIARRCVRVVTILKMDQDQHSSRKMKLETDSCERTGSDDRQHINISNN